MAGQAHGKLPRLEAYGSAVRELAKRLGWNVGELWKMFDQMALMAEYELRIPRDAAEAAGWRWLCACVEKQGAEDPT